MLTIFNYENKTIRTVKYKNDSWFVAKDVSDILGYKDSIDAVKKAL